MSAQPTVLNPRKPEQVAIDASGVPDPDWWGGHHSTLKVLCAAITDILDGRHSRVAVPTAPWEPVRRRLVEVVERAAGQPAQQKSMRWIHVDEDMPTQDGRYLVAYRTPRGQMHWREASLIIGKWFCSGEGFDPASVAMWCQVEVPEA